MAIVRRRYYFWLIRAYFKRWYKTILSSLVIGVLIFFAIGFIVNFYVLPSLQKKVQKIGLVGVYSPENIPDDILSDVSFGLVKISQDGSVLPAAAYKWEIRKNGKEYIFYLKSGQRFQNGRELTSETLPLSFKDVNKKNLSKYTVSMSLNSPYSPFLGTVSKPILLRDLAGLGKYKIKKIDINGGFVRSLTIEDTKDNSNKKVIMFYPTEEALKDAYALGDIDEAKGIQTTSIKNTNFTTWSNTKIAKAIDYDQLVTLFYNNEDKYLSNKKIRQALSYAIPSSFSEGKRVYSPIRPKSIYFFKSPNYGISDIEISNNLLKDEADVKKTTIEISSPEEYLPVAQKVADRWKKIGIKSKIKTVSGLPRNFQVLIYPIKLPQDPDQYTLWHSAQLNNITHYKNLRIDKLLEDGRSISQKDRRIEIYADFQKYLIDDAPATFLYFPKTYTLVRK